jgi:hypothetical protein
VAVVVVDVGREDSFQVAAVEDQDPVEALAADAADPAFDEGVRAWCAYRCADDPDRLGAEDFVEGGRELAVAVMDQEPDRLRPVDERLDDVAGLLGRPLAGRVGGHSGQIHLPRRELDEHEHVEPTQEHGLDGEEVATDDAAGLAADERTPGLR